jgi:hypothetical protein
VKSTQKENIMENVYVLMIKDEDNCADGWNHAEVFLTEDSAIQYAHHNSPMLRMNFSQESNPDTQEEYLFAYDGISISYSIFKRNLK